MRLDGLVLVVEGLHHAKLADGTAGKVVHHALAIASADPAGGFRFSTFLADGRAADARGNWENGKFVWAPPAPPGRQIRYIIDWTVADRWSEIGEMSTDGATWTKFFEMNLSPSGVPAPALGPLVRGLPGPPEHAWRAGFAAARRGEGRRERR